PAAEPEANAAQAVAQVVPDDPNKPYDVRQLILGLTDQDSFLELQPAYAQNMVIGFGRLAGRVVAWCANQPRILAGCLDIDASDKLARFVRFADAFNVPLLTLIDTPGYLPGTAQEYGGIIRHGAKVLYAYSEASVAKISVVLRKAYGGAYLAMCSKSLGADLVLALPTAEIAVMGPEGAANIIFRAQIEAAADQDATRKRLVAEYRDRFSSPYVAAARQYVDQVVTAEELRHALIAALWALGEKSEDRPAKKHGNIPL
ncbi:MAG: acyl-CoA carboxylase subunit beta, partial [Sulfobacillus sp.]